MVKLERRFWRKWMAALSFLSLPVLIYSVPVWSPYEQHTSGVYSKEVMTLSLVRYKITRYQKKPDFQDTLVLLPAGRGHENLKTWVANRLAGDFRILTMPPVHEHQSHERAHQKRRVAVYLRKKGLLGQWPPFYAGYRSFVEELSALESVRTGVVAPMEAWRLLTGDGANRFAYDYFVFISPGKDLLEESPDLFSGKRILWIGTRSEEGRLNSLKKRFGGEVMAYDKAGRGYMILSRNHLAAGRLLEWIGKP